MKPSYKLEPWLYLLPALLAYTFAVLVPVIWSLVYSFYDWNGIGAMEFAGLGNYVRMMRDSKMLTAIKNNFYFMGLGTVIQIFMGLFMATLLYNLSRGNNILRVLYFIPCIISSMAVCKIFEKLLSVQPQGLVAAIVQMMGGKPMAFLSSPQYALTAVTLIDAYKFMGLYMVIFYSAFMAIDHDVIEASYIDGCTWWKQYIYIMLPMIKPIFFTVLVIVVNGTLKGYDIAAILTKGGPGSATELVSTYMYKISFGSTRFGYGSAISMFLLAESLIAVGIVRFFGNRSEKKGLLE